jgi:hypothetical protein
MLYALKLSFTETMLSKTDVKRAEEIASKYLTLCCNMLAVDGVTTKRYNRFATLLVAIVQDELYAYCASDNSTLNSIEEHDIMTYIGDVYENFIEPMFMDHCIPKRLTLPRVDLVNVKKLREAKTKRKVTFCCN